MKTNQRPHLGGRRANSSRSQRITEATVHVPPKHPSQSFKD